MKTFGRFPLVRSAVLGAALWLLLLSPGWSAEPLRDLDRFLLLAVLVITPLGLSLAETSLPSRAPSRVARVQPLAAAFVAASFAVDPGIAAGLLSSAWLLFAAAIACAGLPSLARIFIDLRGATARCFIIAKLYLAVGGAWLVAARIGIEPLGFGEPFVSLTAIHFHFAGFATAMLAGATTLRLGSPSRAANFVVLALLAGPPLVAAGFLLSPLARVFAVTLFGAGVAGLAILLFHLARIETRLGPRVLFLISALSVLFTITCAVGYALDEWLGLAYLTVPRMVLIHGWVNALGFIVPGLLAFSIARPAANRSCVGRGVERVVAVKV